MRRYPSAFQDFKTGERGSVAIMFAVALLALVMCAGGAVDFSRTYNSKEVLQQDLDAAVLYAGTQLVQAGTNQSIDAQAAVQTYLDGLVKRQAQTRGAVVASVNQPTPTKIHATATAQVPAKILHMFGFHTFNVVASSDVDVGQPAIEVALVLDNTASMTGAKLDGLKQAAKSMIDVAYRAPNAAQHVKFGIIPFAQYVNVGLGNRNQSWISVPADGTTTGPQTCSMVTPIVSQTNCRQMTGSYLNDGVPATYTYTECDNTYGPPVQQCSTPTYTTTWNGCVGSRNYPLDTLDEQYSSKESGLPNTWCPSEITPLTNDQSALGSQIDAMIATGETYIPAGLMWGWRVLSKDMPYDQALDYGQMVDGQPVHKYMVLMTDGENTLSPTYPAHDGGDTALSNKLTAEVCTNIKAKGIEIYTVAFDVQSQTAKDLLLGCASSPSKYFDAADTQQLQTAFNSIAKDFSPLRITN